MLLLFGTLDIWERIQRRWTPEVNGLRDLSSEERLKRLDQFSFQGHLLRADLILVYKILHNRCAIGVEEVFLLDRSRDIRGYQNKLFKPRT